MKKTDLIRVIREIVRQEIKKELPVALSQVFTQMMNGAHEGSVSSPTPIRPSKKTLEPAPKEAEEDDMSSLRSQLQEMFNGEAPVRRPQPRPSQKQFTKNPVLNEILNQTRPFNSSEKMALRTGGGGGLSMMAPSVALAASQLGTSIETTPGVGEMMTDNDLGFMRNVPGMPGSDVPMLTELPTNSMRVSDGQTGGSAPMEVLGEASALDVKNHPALPDSIKSILNRDYRALVRAMDKKK